MARAATPPTTPPTIAPTGVECLWSSLSGSVICVAVLLVEVELEVEVDVVLKEASMTSCGSSFIDMMVGVGKHRYIDLAGVPVQR